MNESSRFIEVLKFVGESEQLRLFRELLEEKVDELTEYLLVADELPVLHRTQGRVLALRELLDLLRNPEKKFPTYRPSRRGRR